MAIYQVSRVGSRFGVVVDGVVTKTFDTRGEAVGAALKMKEGDL